MTDANYTIVITEKGGKPRTEQFDQNEITIGRVQGNDIVLPKGNISKRHSRIVLKDGKFIIVDLKSTNGTYVNGKRISAPQVLKETDKIYIGDFTLTLEMVAAAAAAAAAAREVDSPQAPADAKNGVDFEDDGEDLFADDDRAPDAGADVDADLDQGDFIPPAKKNGQSGTPQRVEPARAPEKLLERNEKPERERADKLDRVEKPAERERPVERAPEPRAPERAPEPRPVRRDPPPPAPPSSGKRRELSIELPPLAALQARQAVFHSVTKALSPDGGLPPDDEVTLEKARSAAEKTLNHVSKKLQNAATEGWPLQIAKEVCALGPLGELLEDPSVTEIFINGPHQILVRRSPEGSSIGAAVTPVQAFFSSDEAVALVVRRIVHAAGLRFDAEHPIAEARLADGARVNAVHHAAAVKGPLVTITRSSTRNATLADLTGEGVLSSSMAEFLELCVRSRRNICLCGGAGAGTGTLLSALASTIADEERIVVVEQVARLKLGQPHVVTLEPRPLKGGPSAAGMRDLVANAVRMRPSRLIVHEVNGGEALELSMAMAGRQDGTLFTTYASTTRDCLDRLETQVRMAGLDVQSKVVREQLASSVDIVVCLTRFADGSSRVTQVSEVTGVEVDLVRTQDIFVFKREGIDEDGGVTGRFLPTGTPPRFYEELQRRGDSVDLSLFRD